MTQDKNREAKDAVTIGQIRAKYLKTLSIQIEELNRLIMCGSLKKPLAESFLKNDIGRTLDELDRVDAIAGVVVLKSDANPVQNLSPVNGLTPHLHTKSNGKVWISSDDGDYSLSKESGEWTGFAFTEYNKHRFEFDSQQEALAFLRTLYDSYEKIK